MDRLRAELGFPVEVIEGQAEARYGFLGGARGLPVEHGLLFDLGGGSLQVIRFFQRTLDRAWSLPLGSLRLSQSFLLTDPPAEDELRRLRKHVRRTLEDAGVPALRPGEELVGTGGTAHLARTDAHARAYPTPVSRLRAHHDAAGMSPPARFAPPRSASGSGVERRLVVGARWPSDADGMWARTTSGCQGAGVRGFARTSGEGRPRCGSGPASLTGRRVERRPRGRRAAVAAAPVSLPPSVPGPRALGHAARVLDVGRAVVFSTATSTPLSSCSPPDLDGFTHRGIALSRRSSTRRGTRTPPGPLARS
jgi:hypothetical protein